MVRDKRRNKTHRAGTSRPHNTRHKRESMQREAVSRFYPIDSFRQKLSRRLRVSHFDGMPLHVDQFCVRTLFNGWTCAARLHLANDLAVALYKSNEGEDWEAMYDAYKDMSRVVG